VSSLVPRSQGLEDRLSLRVYGSKAGLEWHQQEPNKLIYKPAGEPWRYLRSGQRYYLGEAAKAAARTPAGHPEGYLEVFANMHRGFIDDVRRAERREPPLREYPGVHDGLRGPRFIAQAVASSNAGSIWLGL
jgi:predicted dehydrogenase